MALWIGAHKRLLARPQQRRILMVISDGAPVDDSTPSVNPGTIGEAPALGDRGDSRPRSPGGSWIANRHRPRRHPYYRRAVTIVDAEEARRRHDREAPPSCSSDTGAAPRPPTARGRGGPRACIEAAPGGRSSPGWRRWGSGRSLRRPRARADLPGPVPLDVRTYPVPHFGSSGLVDGLYGRLRYRAGLRAAILASRPSAASRALVRLDDGPLARRSAITANWPAGRTSWARGSDAARNRRHRRAHARGTLTGDGRALLGANGLYDAKALTRRTAQVAYVGFELLGIHPG